MKLFKKPIFVSISPNAQSDDVWLALRLLFSPWQWAHPHTTPGMGVNGDAAARFTEEFKTYIGARHVFLFDSGRTSLYAIVKALDLKEDDEVLVQALTCTAAVNPILWVGAKPVYVDIEAETYNMDPRDLLRKISPRSKAVIIQHTFGIPANLDEILLIAKNHNLFVIEDVAHALGGEYRDKRLGTFGDAAVFSFGRYKIISSVFGGAAVVQNEKIAKRLSELYDGLPFPSRFWIFEQLFHPVLLALVKPLYNIFSIGKALVIIARKLKLISLSVYTEEKQGGRPGFGPSKMPNALAILGRNQFRKLEAFNRHREELAACYQKELRNIQGITLPRAPTGSRPIFLNFPITLPDDSTALNLIGAGRREEGIYLENWPAKKVIGPRGTNLDKLMYVSGSCPVAESVAPRVVTLPTNPNTTREDALHVADLICHSLA
ncbi:aminotransferase class V-fold PLP-dependent enzyme [Candidatus Wolfebacteria bacterium]|nr:aminotransferase class V-fold PLP-dependent enzyme [Candidatus Wolfebacteria bacterium]